MDLHDYVRMLRRRWRLLVLATIVCVGAAAAFTFTQTKQYTATSDLFVSAQGSAAQLDNNSAYAGGLFTQARVKSYVSIINSPKMLLLIADKLDEDVAGASISAAAPLDQVIIHVSATDPDPERAQRLANDVGAIFPDFVDELERPVAGGPSPIKVSVIQTAALPKRPTSPRPKLNIALGLLVGLALGMGAAMLRETLDTTVSRPDELEALLGAPVIGAVNFDPETPKHPLGVLTRPHSVQAEAVRQLRTNLQFVEIEHELASVVITSAVPDEGKSTSAANLAITLAQAGLRVIVVEADLRRPKLVDLLGLEGAVGLTSVLLGQVDLEHALQRWGKGLDMRVLPSGPLPPNPSELLGSERMQELVQQLEGLADMVIIDAPPLLPVTDAAVLGTLASGVVIVVRAGKTRREQVTHAAAAVRGVGGSLLGGVLNMVPTKGPDAYSYGTKYTYDRDRQRKGHQAAPVETDSPAEGSQVPSGFAARAADAGQ